MLVSFLILCLALSVLRFHICIFFSTRSSNGCAIDSTNASVNIPTLLVNWVDDKKRAKEEELLINFVKYRAKLDTIQLANMNKK